MQEVRALASQKELCYLIVLRQILAMESSSSCNWESSCLCFPNAGTTGLALDIYLTIAFDGQYMGSVYTVSA